MDLAAIHQHNSSLGRKYIQKPCRLERVTASPCTRWPFTAIKCASRRIAPPFSHGAEQSVLPPSANWSVYNTFNYPVRSFAVGKLTPGTRRVPDDGPCTHFHRKADRMWSLARELHKPTLEGIIYPKLQDYTQIYTPLPPDSIRNRVATFPLKSPSAHPDSSALFLCSLLIAGGCFSAVTHQHRRLIYCRKLLPC